MRQHAQPRSSERRLQTGERWGENAGVGRGPVHVQDFEPFGERLERQVYAGTALAGNENNRARAGAQCFAMFRDRPLTGWPLESAGVACRWPGAVVAWLWGALAGLGCNADAYRCRARGSGARRNRTAIRLASRYPPVGEPTLAPPPMAGDPEVEALGKRWLH
jgi:hypothetical protein